ncbi:hypothetical protein FACS1894124_3290 [Spirochaetia bacterium]|nr:hypothetical protein FACS1894124_3290 [Spirochaetia bacterium]
MKKMTRVFVITLVGLLCAGSLVAQSCRDKPAGFAGDSRKVFPGDRGRTGPAGPQRRRDGPPREGRHQPVPAETVTVNGTLQLVEGRIAVVSDGKTYFTHDLQRLIGFIDGLKESASVTLEGAAYPVPNNADARFLRVTKLTFNGKTYDFPTPEERWGRKDLKNF